MKYNDDFDLDRRGEWIIVHDDAGELRRRRAQLGLTQQQVADIAGIKLVQYQRLESGERSIYGASMRIGAAVCKALYLDPLRFAEMRGRMVVSFPYYARCGGESGGGSVDVMITEDEWHSLVVNRGNLHLSDCEGLDSIEKKVMMSVMVQEVGTYLSDEDLLEELFDGEEISRDPKEVWSALTDMYEYGVNFPENLQRKE